MKFRNHKVLIVISLLTALLPFATASTAASDDAQREKETSGVTPDKTNTSSGEARREGTGEGRATPSEKAPTKSDGR